MSQAYQKLLMLLQHRMFRFRIRFRSLDQVRCGFFVLVRYKVMARKNRDLFGLVFAYDSRSVTVLVVSAWTSLHLLRDSFSSSVSGRQLLVDSNTRINRSKLGVHVRPQLCWLWINHCSPLLVESRLHNSYSYSLELSYSHLSWASLWLGFHTLGIYMHNDSVCIR